MSILPFFTIRKQLSGDEYLLNDENERYIEFVFLTKKTNWYLSENKGRFTLTEIKAKRCT